MIFADTILWKYFFCYLIIKTLSIFLNIERNFQFTFVVDQEIFVTSWYFLKWHPRPVLSRIHLLYKQMMLRFKLGFRVETLAFSLGWYYQELTSMKKFEPGSHGLNTTNSTTCAIVSILQSNMCQRHLLSQTKLRKKNYFLASLWVTC